MRPGYPMILGAATFLAVVTLAVAAGFPEASAESGLPLPAAGHPAWNGLGVRGALVFSTLLSVMWLFRNSRRVNPVRSPGFEVISPSEVRAFIPLEDRFQAMDFVGKFKTKGGLRVSANLNKVTLSIRKYGFLMEDKNYRNALLVNRRRVRRTLLRDGDVLDLGDLTLLYRDHRQVKIIRYSSVTPGEGKSQIKFERLKGPVRKGLPMLVPEQKQNRIFYMTKNLVFIGRSESNDLVIKSRAVHYRHAKIERVGGRFKLQDLSVLGNTFVNNRRVEQRFLREGDEISIESHRFKFQFTTRAMRDRAPVMEAPSARNSGDSAKQEGDAGMEEEVMQETQADNGGEESYDGSAYPTS